MGRIKDAMLGPRRDDPRVVELETLAARRPKPWTDDGRRRVRLENDLGPRVVGRLIDEGRI
jgi:hypothetical protein